MGWRYYNHAMIPDSPPHQKVDTSPIQNGSVWKIHGGGALLARWTSDFDCGIETNWWHCIKDSKFDLSELPSKKRYEINKGKKNFTVLQIDPATYADSIIGVQEKAWRNYPKAYRPAFDAEKKRIDISNWKKYRIFGAFGASDGVLCAYGCMEEHTDWVNFVMLKADPVSEKLAVNAAVVAAICEYYNNRLSGDFYIYDGERNIIHKTAFQEYLIKHFGFRKAYCRLNISYKPLIGFIVRCIYPFRKLIHIFHKTKIGSKIDAVLLMEGFKRADE